MSTTEAQTASPDARVGKVDMKLEIHVIPVSDVDRSKQFYERLGWRLDDDVPRWTAFASSSSRPRAPGRRSRLAGDLPRPRRARPWRGWSSRTSKRLMPNSSAVALTPVRCGTARRSLPRPGNPAWIPSAPAMRRFSPSRIPTAMCGWSRRSRRGCPAGRTMDFLVEFEVDVPAGTSETEVKDREKAEAVAATRLADEGHLLRVWKRPLSTGETNVIGLYRAKSKTELDGLLSALPLYEWMTVTVTGLERHPNDPAAAQETGRVAAGASHE